MTPTPQGMMNLAAQALAVEASGANAQIHLAQGSHCITPAGMRGEMVAALEQTRAAHAAAAALIAELEGQL